MGLFSWFSGRNKYEKAKVDYDELVEEYDDARYTYEVESEQLNQELAKRIEEINGHKEYIQMELFAQLVELLALLKDVEIPEEFCEEQYLRQCRKLDSFQKIKSRESLMAIDFDGKKVKTALQAIFTLGIYTRKKAKESLSNIETERHVMEKEMDEMDSEIVHLKALVESATNIAYYFEKMTSLFEKWLRYMEHAVHYIGYAAMRMSKRLLKRSISISWLHEKQQKELEATINLGRVLSQMIQMQIVVGKKDSNLKEYERKMKDHYKEFEDEE